VGPQGEDGWLRAVGGYPYHSRVGQKSRRVQGIQPEGSGQKQRVTLTGKVSHRSHPQVRGRQLLSVVSITILLLVVIVVAVVVGDDIVVVVVIMISIDIDVVTLLVIVVFVVITFIIVSLPVGEVVTMAVVVVIVIVIIIVAVVCVTVFARGTQYSVNAKRQSATRIDAAFFITNFLYSVLLLVGI
jgi:hypothetical protein